MMTDQQIVGTLNRLAKAWRGQDTGFGKEIRKSYTATLLAPNTISIVYGEEIEEALHAYDLERLGFASRPYGGAKEVEVIDSPVAHCVELFDNNPEHKLLVFSGDGTNGYTGPTPEEVETYRAKWLKS